MGGSNGYDEDLETRKCLCCWSVERELHISRKCLHDLMKIPKALMERFSTWTDLIFFLSSVRREAYLFLLQFELETTIMMIILVILGW